MIKDNIDMSVKGNKVKGTVKIELFNSNTGELEYTETKDNFVSNIGWDYYPLRKVSAITGQASAGTELLVPNIGRASLFLSDDSREESPETEVTMRGNLIGYSRQREGFSGSDAYRGSYNAVESYSEAGKEVMVYDFPTNAGNGTFQSIGFSHGQNLSYNPDDSQVYPMFTETYAAGHRIGRGVIAEELDSLILTESMVYALDKPSNTLFIKLSQISDDYIWAVDLETKEVRRLGDFKDTIKGMCVDNGFLWCCKYGTVVSRSKIYKLNFQGDIIQEIPSPDLSYLDKISMTPTGLWVTSTGGTQYVSGTTNNNFMFKISQTTGKVESYRQLPKMGDSALPTELVYYDGIWWCKYGHNVHFIEDIDGELVPTQSITTTATRTSNLTFCPLDKDKGQIIYVGDTSGKKPLLVESGQKLISRVLLSQPQTKNNTQTMKVTYEMNYDIQRIMPYTTT